MRATIAHWRYSPSNAAVHNNRGSLLHSLGRYDEALKAFDRALALQPSLPTTWHNRGLALSMLGQRAEALRSFERVLEIDPGNRPAHFQRGGRRKSHSAGTPKPLASYDRALERAPEDFQAPPDRAEALQLLDRHGEAITKY